MQDVKLCKMLCRHVRKNLDMYESYANVDSRFVLSSELVYVMIISRSILTPSIGQCVSRFTKVVRMSEF